MIGSIIFEKTSLRTLFLCLLILFSPFSGKCATILSVSGQIEGGFYGISASQAAATSWSQSATYADTGISALLSNGPANGTAYLMSSIGPGTTPADEIARANFQFPSSTTMVVLFDDLTLSPGTYYLVIGSRASSSQIGGLGDALDCGTNCAFPAPAITLASGVTRHPDFLAPSGAVNAYAPASAFQQNIGIHGDPFIAYTIDSAQVAIASVPEPGTLQLFAVIALAVAANRLRLSRRNI